MPQIDEDPKQIQTPNSKLNAHIEIATICWRGFNLIKKSIINKYTPVLLHYSLGTINSQVSQYVGTFLCLVKDFEEFKKHWLLCLRNNHT